MRTPDEFRDEGVRNAAGAHALANAATELLDGEHDQAVIQACAHLLHKAGNLADHAALMFRLADRPSDDASADSEPKEG